MSKQKDIHLGVRIDKELETALLKHRVSPYENTSQLIRDILREWAKKKKKKSV